jgi:hypothetical protein
MARGITDVLKDIREGALLTELPQQLGELVAAVRATGKGGRLTLTLNIKPLSANRGNQVLITDEVRCAMPEPDRETTVLFITDENELTRRDPRQPKLPEMGVVRNLTDERKADSV